ncbi:MAG: N-formylglutamate amidohydrolase, partial [Pseudomonadota bacterium]
RLGAPALLGGYSRLLYDCNRPTDAADAVPVRSEIFDIPGNQNLSDLEKQRRIDSFYKPFHTALSAELDRHDRPLALITIHSFTPVYLGRKRDVEIGILHDEDPRLADAVLQLAPQHTSLLVLKNEPYGPGDGVMHTLKKHGIARGILNVMIEVRNDLLQSEAQCREIADLLVDLLNDAMPICIETPAAQRAGS